MYPMKRAVDNDDSIPNFLPLNITQSIILGRKVRKKKKENNNNKKQNQETAQI